jgi:hypothetical protein
MRLVPYGCVIGTLNVAAVISGCNGSPVARSVEADTGAQQEAAGPDSTTATADCPLVGPVTVDPGETAVGGEVDVSVPIDSDAADVSYTWTSTDGQFQSSNAPKTRFDCTAAGAVTISVQVTGGSQPDGGPCTEVRTALVQCFPAPLEDATPTTGLCSPTVEAFVQGDPTGTCYPCLLGAGCLDGVADGATGNECEDLTGDAVTGPSAGAWKPSLCVQTINCILTTRCANPSVVNCYCGAGDSAACADAGSPKGACLVAENAGLETSDPVTALGPSFTSKNLAAGVANAIFVCAAANGCTSCLGPTSGAEGGEAEATPEASEAGD